jgi:hypothetical protein
MVELSSLTDEQRDALKAAFKPIVFPAQKSDVGLSNVDNTPDTTKPISIPADQRFDAIEADLVLKQNSLPTGTALQFIAGNHTLQNFSKALVNLDQVDNTSDINKPLSNAMTTALSSKLSASSNLNDLTNKPNARANLGLSPIAASGNADDLVSGSNNFVYTATERDKLGRITVTGSINLDNLVTRVNELGNAFVLVGSWAPGTGTFPATAGIKKGHVYLVTGNGTVNGVEFTVGDRLTALIDSPSSTVFDNNWFKEDYTDRVSSVAGRTGNVVLSSADLTDATTDAKSLLTKNLAAMKTFLGIQATISYTDLTNKPTFATVATSGSYTDLTNKPTLGTVASLNTGTAAGNVPVLQAGGLLDPAILPNLAIIDVFVVNSQASMLALTAQKGDVAVRTDLSKTFILSANAPGTLSNWVEVLSPSGGTVVSVAGLTGAITAAALKTALGITASDITNSSADGRSILTAATFADIRSLLGLTIGTTADYRSNVANRLLTTDQVNASGAVITLTDDVTIAWDMNLGWNAQVTLAGNRTLGNPVNPIVGRGGFLKVTQDATGNRTLLFGANWDFAGGTAPTLSTTAGAVDFITYFVASTTSIVVTGILKAVS